LETRLEQTGKDWEWAEIIRGLDNLTEVTLAFRAKKYALRCELSGQAGLALRAAGVAVPQTRRELPPDKGAECSAKAESRLCNPLIIRLV